MKIRLRGRKLAGGLGPLLALCLIVTLAVPALANGVPPLPRDHSFWGTVTICGAQAEEGTVVTAKIADVADEWTSTVVDIEGYDGYYGLNDPPDYPDNLLEVPADDPATPGIKEGGVEGDTVEFWVLGKLAGDALFVPDGTTRLDLPVIEVDLTVDSGTGGTVNIPGVGTYPYPCGEDADLLADAELGYEFDEWTGDAAAVAAVDNVTAASTFITMNGFYSITATFTFTPIVTLTVSKDGDGTGTVTSAPAGINCGGDCNEDYDYNTAVILTAVADAESTFTAWSGHGTGDAPGTRSVTMDGNKTVTATFAFGPPCELTVNANPPEGGEVTGAGSYTCDALAPIAATPDSCYEFVNWSGAGITDPDSASTTVLVDEDKTVTANFALLEYTLTVNASPAEGGTVTGGGTYDCCTYQPITATPVEDWFFVNWSGAGITNPNSASTTVHIDSDKTVTANFLPIEPTVLTVNSTDGGSVTAPGEGVFPYPGGTVVPLVADPDPCANFTGWTGDVSTIADINAATTTITMNDDYTITANFVPPEVLKVVTLNDGWNTFSTPLTLNQCTNTWSKLEEENNLTGLYMIYRFDVSTGYWALITGGDPVRPLEGYYVNMTTEGETVSIIPDREPPLIPPSAELSNGLNFIGTPSLGDLDVVTALLDIYEAAGGYSKVINPDENDPWTSNIYSRDIPPVPIMVACKAYWVVMPNPGAVLVGVLPPPL